MRPGAPRSSPPRETRLPRSAARLKARLTRSSRTSCGFALNNASAMREPSFWWSEGSFASALLHQNEGSRMALALFKANPHEVRLERVKRAFKRAAERGNRVSRGGDDRGAPGRILKPGAGPQHESPEAGHLFGGPRLVEGRIEFGEIPNIRTVQNRSAQLDRLAPILAATSNLRLPVVTMRGARSSR